MIPMLALVGFIAVCAGVCVGLVHWIIGQDDVLHPDWFSPYGATLDALRQVGEGNR